MALACYQTAPAAAARTVLVPTALPALRAAALPMDVLWHPDATRRPLPRDMGGALTRSRGLILHVQAGDNSPHGWFNRDDVQASSHWWVSRAGRLEQYVPADRVAWAQAAGNSAWHSVETEGWPGEGLTAEQIGTLSRLYRWGHDHWGWALHLADDPAGTGLGWHGMGGAAWGGHPDCPGPIRLAQRPAILAGALGAAIEQEDDVTPEEMRAVLNEGTGAGQTGWAGTSRETLAVGQRTFNQARAAADGVTALAAAVSRIERGLSVAAPAAAEVMAVTPPPLLTVDYLIGAVSTLDPFDAIRPAEAAAGHAAAAMDPGPTHPEETL